ncbi:uracil-DNA glycosylase family protein [uncultured Dokdonia sp.]|uniref:uracil-DNA glycosylase family protein n=1 Tax=uncultured Dokdonia sp. TaxID=575653 RepID=UPI002612B93B|nr:uracil-DNA glycosylase family protein [uncultured Dokdonia sp.]
MSVFLHTHPYEPYNLEGATKIIVGTLPPPRFTTGDLNDKDVDFCYGSSNGQLWPILDKIFNLGLVYENTHHAIEQRKHFLLSRKIGVCDIVASSERIKIDASDIGMQNVQLRDIFGYLAKHPNIDTLLFTGGNSKNGPEYFFRRKAKEQNIKLDIISNEVPRIHSFAWAGRTIKTVSLTAPSGAANRAVGSLALYKKLKNENPAFTTIDFRVLQYTPFF